MADKKGKIRREGETEESIAWGWERRKGKTWKVRKDGDVGIRNESSGGKGGGHGFFLIRYPTGIVRKAVVAPSLLLLVVQPTSHLHNTNSGEILPPIHAKLALTPAPHLSTPRYSTTRPTRFKFNYIYTTPHHRSYIMSLIHIDL